MTATVAKVPEDERGKLLWALVLYGTYGEEPGLEYPLDAIFESLREDIDNSKNAIYNGKTGGRGKKKGSSDNAEPPSGNGETPLSETVNPPFECPEDGETPLFDGGNGGSEDAKPKPYQSIPVHTKPDKSKAARFAPPSVGEVREYCVARGYAIDPEQFVSFYESKGWTVGKSPMKSWQAACTTWHNRESPRPIGGDGDDYSAL